jgi:integrase
MRKGELCGLKWEDVDLDARKVRGVRQLASPQLGEDGQPVFGPTKTGRVRTITIDSETAALLREHRKTQREAMMQRRSAHQDFGLVFTRDDGEPLLMNNLGQREYAKLITAAGVKAIKFHGLRHTCATLLLQAGTPVHVVSERLGHSKVSMTLEVYAHVLPDMQNDAAAALGALLHRR